MSLGVAEVRAEVEHLIAGLEDGAGLDARSRAFIEYGVRICVTCLDVDGAGRWAEAALDAGATAEQLEEINLFVSGVGMHAVIEGSRALARVIATRGERLPDRDEMSEELWARYRADGSFWVAFEAQMPGFLDTLVRLSPQGFAGFMEFGVIPTATGHVEPLIRELIAVAADATPTHRYLPGLRAHLQQAIRLGATRTAVLETLGIAAAAPEHRGVR